MDLKERSAASVTLQAVRLERGLSQQSAAEINGLQGSVWSKLETGKLTPYSIELAMKLKGWMECDDAGPEDWLRVPSAKELTRLERARSGAKPRSRRAA